MPIEVMAKRGTKTMLYGPMKPVGLEYPEDYKGPRDGDFKTPYAVVQLRQDNAAGSLYNIVGFQTHLKWGEQKRVFQMIPGLENAEIMRTAYAIEYDCIDPTQLKASLEFKTLMDSLVLDKLMVAQDMKKLELKE